MYHKVMEFVDRHYRVVTTILYCIITMLFLFILFETIDVYAHQVLDAKVKGHLQQEETLMMFSKVQETEEEIEAETEAETEVETEVDVEINETVVDEKEAEVEETEAETEPVFSDEEIDWMEQESEALYSMYYDIQIDRALYTVQYFVDCGFSVEGACGIAGNIYAESNFEGSADNNGWYHGICQWSTGDRWIKIANYTYSNHGNTEDFYAQVDAILNSADADSFQDTFAVMKTMSSAEEAAIYWLNYYEIAPGQAEQKRMDASRLIRLKYLLDQA